MCGTASWLESLDAEISLDREILYPLSPQVFAAQVALRPLRRLSEVLRSAVERQARAELRARGIPIDRLLDATRDAALAHARKRCAASHRLPGKHPRNLYRDPPGPTHCPCCRASGVAADMGTPDPHRRPVASVYRTPATESVAHTLGEELERYEVAFTCHLLRFVPVEEALAKGG